MPQTVKIDATLEPWALDVVRGLPGVDAVAHLDAGPGHDAEIVVGEDRVRAFVEMKSHVDAGTAHAVVARAQALGPGEQLLLIARTSTAGAREVLTQGGVSYLDGRGFADLRLPGFVLKVAAPSRRPDEDHSAGPARLSGKAGLVAQALLLDRPRKWAVGDVANVAGVSVGLAHRVLARLEADGILASEGRGPGKTRHVARAGALLDLWAEEAREPRLRRTPAFSLMRAVPVEFVSTRLSGAGLIHAVTGSAAAARVAPFLTTVPVTHVRVAASAVLPDILGALAAREAVEGPNLVIVQGADDAELRFRRETDGIWVAADTRIYLDALHDPRRGAEQARAFREQELGY